MVQSLGLGFKGKDSERACFRLPGTLKTVSLANGLPSRNPRRQPRGAVRSRERPGAHTGRPPPATPDPFAPPHPEKTVPFPRHPFPAVSHPFSPTLHQFPFVRSFFPQIRPHPAISPPPLRRAHISAIIPYGRGGFQTRPRDRPAPGIRSSAPCGHTCNRHSRESGNPGGVLFCHAT